MLIVVIYRFYGDFLEFDRIIPVLNRGGGEKCDNHLL